MELPSVGSGDESLQSQSLEMETGGELAPVWLHSEIWDTHTLALTLTPILLLLTHSTNTPPKKGEGRKEKIEDFLLES